LDVTAVAISNAISIGPSLLPPTVPPVSRLLLSLPLTPMIATVKHISSRVVIVVAYSFVDVSG
jgi:hypothetical protein